MRTSLVRSLSGSGELVDDLVGERDMVGEAGEAGEAGRSACGGNSGPSNGISFGASRGLPPRLAISSISLPVSPRRLSST